MKCELVISHPNIGVFLSSVCDYRCHGRCLEGTIRRCASLRVSEDPTYILRICPEVGLAAQGYKCAECKRLITNSKSLL